MNCGSPERLWPATSAYVRTRTATADSVQAAPAAAATAKTRVNAGCSGVVALRSGRAWGRIPTAKISPPITVAKDTLWMALATGSPQRTRAPGSETCRAAEAPEKIKAPRGEPRGAQRTRQLPRQRDPFHGNDYLGSLLGSGRGAVAGVLADGTYPLSANVGGAANRAVRSRKAATRRLPPSRRSPKCLTSWRQLPSAWSQRSA